MNKLDILKIIDMTPAAIMQTVAELHPEVVGVLEKLKPLHHSRAVGIEQAAFLYMLVKQFVGEDDPEILEIGTAQGFSAAVMAEAAPEAYIETLNPLEHEVEIARKNLALYNVNVIQKASWDYLPQARQAVGGYDFIFVDGDHKRVRLDFPWWDVLKVGGVMLFHDYSPEGSYRACPPVYEAVNEFAKIIGREPDILLVDDGGVGMAGFIKQSPSPLPETDDRLVIQAHLYSALTLPYLRGIYQVAKGITAKGSIVECGAAGGGSLAALAVAANGVGSRRRDVWGFDLMTGTPRPTEADGEKAMLKWQKGVDSGKPWEAVGKDQIWTNRQARAVLKMAGSGCVDGDFADTLPKAKDKVGDIAILHIDATLYESTKVALEHLYDQVVRGGVVIIGGYHHWLGVRTAVSEFLESRGLGHSQILMTVEKGVYWYK